MVKGIWAGLDVGTRTTSVCVINDAGEVLHEAVCPTGVKSVHRELAFMKRRRSGGVFMEACTGMHLGRGLRSLGYNVTLYEARQLSKFLRVRRNKTDAGDASGIAEAGRLGASIVSKVHLKSLDAQALQARLTIRRHLLYDRVAAVNLLARQLDHFGGQLHSGRRSGKLRGCVDAEIRKVFGKMPTPLTQQLYFLVDYCERLFDYEKAVRCELKRLAEENEVCRRFMEIPGVGPLCALTFYAIVDDPHRFRRSADIGPYFGLTPKVRQSGITCRVGRITRMGNRAVRTLLVRASTGFMRCSPANSQLRLWAAGVELRSGRGPSRIALARKLATIMVAMWKNDAHFELKLCSAASD